MSTVRIQIRRGTSTEWTSVNPVLAGGEAGFESDTKKIKIGDGTSSWTALGYATVTPAQLQSAIEGVVAGEISSYATLTELSDAISQEVTDRNAAIVAAIETVGGADFIGIGEKGVANGVAELDSSGHVPDAQIPAAIARDSEVSSATATAKSEAISSARSYSDTIKTEAISTSKSYIDDQITTLINFAPTALDTLGEIALQLASDESAVSALTTTVASKAPSSNPYFTGEARLPANTTIGTITAAEIGYIAGVESPIQGQINEKLSITAADSTYETKSHATSTFATKNDATFTGNITLPSTTQIGNASSTEIGFLDGVTSAIQTQLDSKLNSSTAASTYLTISTASTSYDAYGTAATAESNAESYTANRIGDNTVNGTTGNTVKDRIATAKSQAITTSEGYTDTAISTEVTNRNSAISTAKSEATSTAATYTDSAISTEVTNRNSAISTAISTEVTNRNSAISTAVTNLVNGAPATLDTLAEIASALGSDANLSTTLTNSIATKAPIASPTFTGTVTLPAGTVTSGMILDGTIVNADINDSAAIAYSKLNLTGSITSSDIVDGTITSAKILDGTIVDGDISTSAAIAQSKVSGLTSDLAAKAPLASPTFTGTVSGITKSMVGLANVDNTSDANKPVSTAAQTALDAKLSLAGGTMTGTLVLSGAPTSDLHAVTKLYVDGVSAGINFHKAVRIATTSNWSAVYANGTNGFGATLTASANQSINPADGVTLSVGDRILVKSQTDAKQNGIYDVTNIGGASSKWVITRSADADNNPAGEVAGGDFTFVTEGSTNANTGFILSSPSGSAVLGTDNINYTQFNAAQAILAGTGLSKSGGTLSIDTATTVDLSTTQTMSNKTFVAPVLGSATATSINGTTIPSSKTLVTTADTGTVTSTMILDGTIVDGDISTSAAIATSKISGLDTALAAKLSSATAATTYAPLASPTFTGTVTLPAGTVTSGMILDETIVDADINASAAIAQSKISGLSASFAAKADLASPTFTGTVNAAAVTTTGNVIVGGNLTVNGTTTTINSTTVSTTDSNIEIAKVGTPTDVTANGAGITVKGATDKTINWYSSTGSFTSSENIDIATGKTYKINGTDVLTATAVGGRTIPASNIVGLTDTQTLTNKTLTSPSLGTPTVTGTLTTSASGITFSDATVQTVAGVPSVTTIDNSTFATGTVNLASGLKDYMVKVGANVTITLQQDSAATYPIGTSIDFWANGTGALFAAGTGVTIVNTPGLKFRAVGSVATAMKVAANTWLVFGDLSA